MFIAICLTVPTKKKKKSRKLNIFGTLMFIMN